MAQRSGTDSADRLGSGCRGRTGSIILTPMAPQSPWELLGVLSPAEIFPEVGRVTENTSSSDPAAPAPPATHY